MVHYWEVNIIKIPCHAVPLPICHSIAQVQMLDLRTLLIAAPFKKIDGHDVQQISENLLG